MKGIFAGCHVRRARAATEQYGTVLAVVNLPAYTLSTNVIVTAHEMAVVVWAGGPVALEPSSQLVRVLFTTRPAPRNLARVIASIRK